MNGHKFLKVTGILMIIAAVFSIIAGVFVGGLGALAAGLGAASGLTFAYMCIGMQRMQTSAKVILYMFNTGITIRTTDLWDI